MKKNILLHGATNCGSSNYGDYLYGEIIYSYLIKDYNVDFYQPSNYFMKHLPNYKSLNKMKNDAIVYIPGGYFGEGHNARFRDNVIQFLRFMPLGIWASYKKKKMAVIAVGASPNQSRLLKFGVKRICNHSDFISVRDSISYEKLRELCPSANVIESGDLIVAYSKKLREKCTQQILDIVSNANNKKIMLIHFNSNKQALKMFAEVAKVFVHTHQEYYVVVSSDSLLDNENELFQLFSDVFDGECSHFIYDDPAEFTCLLKKVSLVLTCKLHVGVVSSCYQKSVIAAACHPEKTQRFYSQVGQKERCVSLFDTSLEELLCLLEEYHENGIVVSSDIIKQAEISMSEMDKFLQTI